MFQTRRRATILKAATRVLDSGHYIRGPEVSAFEREFAAAIGSSYCVGLSSGTQALEIALEAAGVGPGDEVIVPAFTFVATAFAVSYLGARPVFADVNPTTLTLDPKDTSAKITSKTRAIIPVHIFGYPADMDSLLGLTKKNNLKVIEDCAQAYGTLYRGKPVGVLGDIGCFSFYPTKNLGAAGDAGAVVTSDSKLHEACLLLRNIGAKGSDKYRHVQLGYNYRLDEIQAAILRVKMRKADAWLKRRRSIADFYRKELTGLPLQLPPRETDGTRHSYHLFVVQTPQRDALANHLAKAGIETGVYYPIALHLQPAYAPFGHRLGDFPNSERGTAEVLALPAHADLSNAQLKRVAEAIRRFYG